MTPVAKILLCLALSLLTAFAVRLCLGDRHEKWFKRQIPKSVITLRTRLSMHLAIGTPVNRQGAAVSAALVAVILLECFLVCHFLSISPHFLSFTQLS